MVIDISEKIFYL